MKHQEADPDLQLICETVITLTKILQEKSSVVGIPSNFPIDCFKQILEAWQKYKETPNVDK